MTALFAIYHDDYMPYRPGWNVSSVMGREKYIWIDPERDSARITNERPKGVPDSELYYRPEEPPFFGSYAHGSFNRSVAALSVQFSGDERLLELFRIHHDVLQAARIDRSQLNVWSSEIVSSMLQDVRKALSSPPFLVSDFTNPAMKLLEDYLTFSVPGSVTQSALAQYFIFLIDSFRSPYERSAECFNLFYDERNDRRQKRILALFLHLRELAATLLIERKKFSLSSFYEMTFLACLIGDVGLKLGRILLDHFGITSELRIQILRNHKMLEEELCYSASPTFVYPALFSEFVVPGELRFIGKCPSPQPFVYPQLDGIDADPNDPMSVLQMIHELTAELPTYNVLRSLEVKNRLLDKQNVRELTDSLDLVAWLHEQQRASEIVSIFCS